MKKTKIFSAAIAGVLATSAMTIPAHAMGLGNGVKSSVSYTYAANDEGVANVLAKDKNETLNKTVNLNETVTSKTGTITWADGYENVTAFYIDAKPGYTVSNVIVDGDKTGKLYNANEDLTVNVNSTLGNDGTYSMPAMNDYDSVFYFLSAGDEAWVKNHSFAITTDKIEYTFVNENGAFLGTGKVGEVANINLEGLELDGHTIRDYTVNGEFWDPTSPITEEMILKNNGSNQFVVEADHNQIKYDVTINYYDNNTLGTLSKQETKSFAVGSVLNRNSLNLADNQFIVGADSVKLTEEGLTVNVVTRKTNTAKNEWLFTFNGKDKHVQKVMAQWNHNNSTDKEIKLNETFKLNTKFAHHAYMTFFVQVDKGYAVNGTNASNGTFKAELVDQNNENYDLYKIEYTRYSNGELHDDPHHESFSLETYLK